jgi:hypothetical protein
MCHKQKQENTRLTLESYGNVYRFEADHCDCDMNEMLYAFYGLLTAATWSPITILQEMKQFADERLELLENHQNSEEENEIN